MLREAMSHDKFGDALVRKNNIIDRVANLLASVEGTEREQWVVLKEIWSDGSAGYHICYQA